jgi:hypothetical protein
LRAKIEQLKTQNVKLNSDIKDKNDKILAKDNMMNEEINILNKK